MWFPPTPSSLCGTWSTILGMKPPTSVPVVSVRYLPTTPLELARPFGNCVDFELSIRRGGSHALAASTATLAFTCLSALVFVSMYVTPLASPRLFSVTSRAIALVTRVKRPVCSAGAINTFVDEKFEFVRHPRPHCPQ